MDHMYHHGATQMDLECAPADIMRVIIMMPVSVSMLDTSPNVSAKGYPLRRSQSDANVHSFVPLLEGW